MCFPAHYAVSGIILQPNQFHGVPFKRTDVTRVMAQSRSDKRPRFILEQNMWKGLLFDLVWFDLADIILWKVHVLWTPRYPNF
jgi:hypothetical protein